MQPKVFDLVLALVRARDRVVTREELIESLWAGIAVSEAALYRLVKEARAALGDDGRRQQVLQTRPKLGLRFVAPVEVIEVVGGAPGVGLTRLRAEALRASGRKDFAEAANLLEQALGLLPGDAPESATERAMLGIEIAQAWVAAQEQMRARRAALAAAEAARVAGDVRWLARAALAIPELMLHGRIDRDFIGLAEEALASPERVDDDLLCGRLQNRLAYHLYWSRDLHRSASCNRAARQIGESRGDPSLLAWVCLIDHMLEPPSSESDDRLALAHGALRHARAAGDHDLETYAREQIAHDAMVEGDLETAGEQADRIESLAERFSIAWPRRVRVLLALHHGDFQAADRALASALEGESAALRIQYRAPQLLWLRMQQGRIAEMLGLLRGFVANASDLPVWRGALALSEWGAGNAELALREYEGMAAFDFRDLPDDFTTPTALTHLAELCAETEDEARAPVLYERLKPMAGRFVVMPRASVVLGPADFFLGRLAATAGQHAAAESHLLAALELAERGRARPALARTHAALAELYAETDAAHAAKTEHANRAGALARALGMAPLAAQLEGGRDTEG